MTIYDLARVYMNGSTEEFPYSIHYWHVLTSKEDSTDVDSLITGALVLMKDGWEPFSASMIPAWIDRHWPLFDTMWFRRAARGAPTHKKAAAVATRPRGTTQSGRRAT